MRLYIVWVVENWDHNPDEQLVGVFDDPREASAVAAACVPHCKDGSVWTEERTLGLPLFPVWDV